MASTNSTTNLQLSQFGADDTPKWLQDYNGDMAKIDAFAGQKGQASGLASLDSSGKLAQMPTAAEVGAVASTEKAQPNGVATLDANGKLVQMAATETGVSNGMYYQKQPDGTAMIWGERETTEPVPANTGYSSGLNITFPFAFTATPSVTATAQADTNSGPATVHVGAVTTGGVYFHAYNGTTATRKLKVYFQIIGKWK